jgi:hypothetical protein
VWLRQPSARYLDRHWLSGEEVHLIREDSIIMLSSRVRGLREVGSIGRAAERFKAPPLWVFSLIFEHRTALPIGIVISVDCARVAGERKGGGIGDWVSRMYVVGLIGFRFKLC